MGLRLTLWLCTLLFIATIWNAATAYSSMANINVQDRFVQIGILEQTTKLAEFPLPAHKPQAVQQIASSN